MTLLALCLEMLAFQRECSCLMCTFVKQRGLEPGHRMAGGTILPGGARDLGRKLPLMLVLVAILALRVGDGLLKVGLRVASLARH